MLLGVSMGHVDWIGNVGTTAGAWTGLALRVDRSRDVSGAEAGFELETGCSRGQGQVTWGCRFQCLVTGRRLGLG